MFQMFLKLNLNGFPIDGVLRETLQISFFFGYWVLSFLANHITGAHYNPAVTVAMLFKRDVSFSRILCIFYLIAQFAGGLVGAILGIIITKNGAFLVIKDASNSYLFQAILIELLASMLFTLIYLTQSDKSTRFSEDPAMVTLFISIAYSSCISIAQPISGGAINPAVGFGLNLINFFQNPKAESIEWIWLYVAVPFVGSLLAVLFYETKFKQVQQQAKQLESGDDSEGETERRRNSGSRGNTTTVNEEYDESIKNKGKESDDEEESAEEPRVANNDTGLDEAVGMVSGLLKAS